jgi:hypothetical protein
MRLACMGRSPTRGEMRSGRLSPELLIQIPKEPEATPLAEVCRRRG